MDTAEFIYLMPGNWFELKNIVGDKLQPYDLDMLKEEILNQINNRAEKLDFINITFGTIYPDAKLEDITFYLDEEKFNKMTMLLTKETRHPIITFHGTKPEAVDSILANGYIIPGKQKNTGVKMAHGAAYGVGIYCSPFFDKANYYAKPDKDGYIYILVNLLFPGRAKLIPPTGQYVCKENSANNSYADGSNTRIVYGLEQIVTCDPQRLVPIAVMKVGTSNK